MIDKQAIAEVLTEVLPDKAEVEFDYNRNDFFASFCWLLGTDPSRPYKRSKKVHFIVTPEALRDFSEVGNKCEARLLINFEAYITHKLDMFEPEHDSPEGAPVPVEKWLIDSTLFLEELESLQGVKRRMF